MPNSDPQKTVFISYRRDASSFIARAIFGDLRLHGYDVFMDVESIDAGTFDTIILRQIAARAHFLIICTPGTFERCGEPGDWLRREIEKAIEQQRNVIPILVNGYKFDEDKRFLTEGLAGVSRLNALTLFHDYFDAGMERLRDRFLKLPFEGDLLPTSKADQPIVKQKIEQIVEQSVPTRDELTAEEYFNRAFERSDEDLEGQIADYTEAIRLNPNYEEAYNNRGVVHYECGDLKSAIVDFTSVIRLNSNDHLAYRLRGEMLFILSSYNEARADFQAALRIAPGSISARAGLAVALKVTNQIKEAKAHWRALVKADPHYRDADWVGKELDWHPELIEAARKLIATLNA